jgi:A/G-specific adenine glycosylase
MLGGLWEFPSAAVPEGRTADEAARRLMATEGLAGEPEPAGAIRHAYSHFRVELSVFACRGSVGTMVADAERRWVTPRQLADLPLHGSHKKALGLL